MQTITINIKNDEIRDELTKLLENFQKEDIEIVAIEDLDDLKLLKATRNEESISFDEYLKNEN